MSGGPLPEAAEELRAKGAGSKFASFSEVIVFNTGWFSLSCASAPQLLCFLLPSGRLP